MESKMSNSEISSRNNISNNQQIIVTELSPSHDWQASPIQIGDYFTLNISDDKLLGYENGSLRLFSSPNSQLVSSNLWRFIFSIVAIDNEVGECSHQRKGCNECKSTNFDPTCSQDSQLKSIIYIRHVQSQMYVCANPNSDIDNASISSRYVLERMAGDEHRSNFQLKLSKKVSKLCKFSIVNNVLGSCNIENEDAMHYLGLYHHNIAIINTFTNKYIEISRNKYLQLGTKSYLQAMKAQISLRIFRSNSRALDKVSCKAAEHEPLRTFNPYSSTEHLQNGDIVLICSSDHTSCLCLQPKDSLFRRTQSLALEVNSSFFGSENYELCEKLLVEVHRDNLIYYSWQVIKGETYSDSLIYARDNVSFQHCLVECFLTKKHQAVHLQPEKMSLCDFFTASGQSHETKQRYSSYSLCPQEFGIKNTNIYNFDSWDAKRDVQISSRNSRRDNVHNSSPRQSSEPLIYLNDVIEVDRLPCYFNKINFDEIKGLKLFNSVIVELAELVAQLLWHNSVQSRIRQSFVNHDSNQREDIRNGIPQIIDQTHANSNGHMHKLVDYDRLMDLINEIEWCFTILVTKFSRASAADKSLSHNNKHYFLSICVEFLDAISSAINLRLQIREGVLRKKNILKPFITMIYEFIMNAMRAAEDEMQNGEVHSKSCKDSKSASCSYQNLESNEKEGRMNFCKNMNIKKLTKDLVNLVEVSPDETLAFMTFLAAKWNPNYVLKIILEVAPPYLISPNTPLTERSNQLSVTSYSFLNNFSYKFHETIIQILSYCQCEENLVDVTTMLQGLGLNFCVSNRNISISQPRRNETHRAIRGTLTNFRHLERDKALIFKIAVLSENISSVESKQRFASKLMRKLEQRYQYKYGNQNMKLAHNPLKSMQQVISEQSFETESDEESECSDLEDGNYEKLSNFEYYSLCVEFLSRFLAQVNSPLVLGLHIHKFIMVGVQKEKQSAPDSDSTCNKLMESTNFSQLLNLEQPAGSMKNLASFLSVLMQLMVEQLQEDEKFDHYLISEERQNLSQKSSDSDSISSRTKRNDRSPVGRKNTKNKFLQFFNELKTKNPKQSRPKPKKNHDKKTKPNKRHHEGSQRRESKFTIDIEHRHNEEGMKDKKSNKRPSIDIRKSIGNKNFPSKSKKFIQSNKSMKSMKSYKSGQSKVSQRRLNEKEERKNHNSTVISNKDINNLLAKIVLPIMNQQRGKGRMKQTSITPNKKVSKSKQSIQKNMQIAGHQSRERENFILFTYINQTITSIVVLIEICVSVGSMSMQQLNSFESELVGVVITITQCTQPKILKAKEPRAERNELKLKILAESMMKKYCHLYRKHQLECLKEHRKKSTRIIMYELKIKQLMSSINKALAAIIFTKKRLSHYPFLDTRRIDAIFKVKANLQQYLQILSEIFHFKKTQKKGTMNISLPITRKAILLYSTLNCKHRWGQLSSMGSNYCSCLDSERQEKIVIIYRDILNPQQNWLSMRKVSQKQLQPRAASNTKFVAIFKQYELIRECINELEYFLGLESEDIYFCSESSRQNYHIDDDPIQLEDENILRHSHFNWRQSKDRSIQYFSDARKDTSENISDAKQLLNLILSKLNEEKRKKNLASSRQSCNQKHLSNAVTCAIMAFEVSERLTQVILCNQYLDKQIFNDVSAFLCLFPPNFSIFQQIYHKLNYSQGVVRVLIKSLGSYLTTQALSLAPENQGSAGLNQFRNEIHQTLVKIFSICRYKLNKNTFILLLGSVCEVFQHEDTSLHIYHLLIELIKESKNSHSFVSKLGSPIQDNEIRQNQYLGNRNSYLNQYDRVIESSTDINAVKFSNSQYNQNFASTFSLHSYIFSYKTIETFKNEIDKIESSDRKYYQDSAHMLNKRKMHGNSFEESQRSISNLQTAVFINQQLAYINQFMTLLFKLCSHNQLVYHHFTQNIIGYDSLSRIAFDTHISEKYKIPLTVYFRLDERVTRDQSILHDYMAWVSSLLSQYEDYKDSIEQYIFDNNNAYELFHYNFKSKKRVGGLKLVKASVKTGEQDQQCSVNRQSEFQNPNSSIQHIQESLQDDRLSQQDRDLIFDEDSLDKSTHYWQMLYSLPFHHKEEGVLVFLEEIVARLRDTNGINSVSRQHISSQKSTAQAASDEQVFKNISAIYENLSCIIESFEQKPEEKKKGVEFKKISRLRQSDNMLTYGQYSIRDNFIQKCRQTILLLKQKFPRLRTLNTIDEFSKQCIAFNIANLLIKQCLLQNFIKVFYYNNYRDLNTFENKHNPSEYKQSSILPPQSRQVTFSNSRTLKGSQSVSEQSIWETQRRIKAKAHQISIKEFNFGDQVNEEQNKSCNGLLVSNQYSTESRRNSLLLCGNPRSPLSTIDVNFNKIHHFEEREYMFYEILKLLRKVCEAVTDKTIYANLEELLVNFYENGGTSTVLRRQIMKVLEYLRQRYLQQGYQEQSMINMGHTRAFNIYHNTPPHFGADTNATHPILKFGKASQTHIMGQIVGLILNNRLQMASCLLCEIQQSPKTHKARTRPTNNIDALIELISIIRHVLKSANNLISYHDLSKYLGLISKFVTLFFNQQMHEAQLSQTDIEKHRYLQIKLRNAFREYLFRLKIFIGKQQFVRSNCRAQHKSKTKLMNINSAVYSNQNVRTEVAVESGKRMSTQAGISDSNGEQSVFANQEDIQSVIYQLIKVYSQIQSGSIGSQSPIFNSLIGQNDSEAQELCKLNLLMSLDDASLSAGLKVIMKSYVTKYCLDHLETSQNSIPNIFQLRDNSHYGDAKQDSHDLINFLKSEFISLIRNKPMGSCYSASVGKALLSEKQNDLGQPGHAAWMPAFLYAPGPEGLEINEGLLSSNIRTCQSLELIYVFFQYLHLLMWNKYAILISLSFEPAYALQSPELETGIIDRRIGKLNNEVPFIANKEDDGMAHQQILGSQFKNSVTSTLQSIVQKHEEDPYNSEMTGVDNITSQSTNQCHLDRPAKIRREQAFLLYEQLQMVSNEEQEIELWSMITLLEMQLMKILVDKHTLSSNQKKGNQKYSKQETAKVYNKLTEQIEAQFIEEQRFLFLQKLLNLSLNLHNIKSIISRFLLVHQQNVHEKPGLHAGMKMSAPQVNVLSSFDQFASERQFRGVSEGEEIKVNPAYENQFRTLYMKYQPFMFNYILSQKMVIGSAVVNVRFPFTMVQFSKQIHEQHFESEKHCRKVATNLSLFQDLCTEFNQERERLFQNSKTNNIIDSVSAGKQEGRDVIQNIYLQTNCNYKLHTLNISSKETYNLGAFVATFPLLWFFFWFLCQAKARFRIIILYVGTVLANIVILNLTRRNSQSGSQIIESNDLLRLFFMGLGVFLLLLLLVSLIANLIPMTQLRLKEEQLLKTLSNIKAKNNNFSNLESISCDIPASSILWHVLFDHMTHWLILLFLFAVQLYSFVESAYSPLLLAVLLLSTYKLPNMLGQLITQLRQTIGGLLLFSFCVLCLIGLIADNLKLFSSGPITQILVWTQEHSSSDLAFLQTSTIQILSLIVSQASEPYKHNVLIMCIRVLIDLLCFYMFCVVIGRLIWLTRKHHTQSKFLMINKKHECALCDCRKPCSYEYRSYRDQMRFQRHCEYQHNLRRINFLIYFLQEKESIQLTHRQKMMKRQVGNNRIGFIVENQQ